MSEKFIIKGGRPLQGTIEIRGCKNAATPILAATLLTAEPCVIDNLPLIDDVYRMIELIKSLGAEVSWLGERKVKIEAKTIVPEKLNQELVVKLRSSILLVGPLIARCGYAIIAQPGGCFIGARPLDTHFDMLKEMGVKITVRKVKSHSGKARKAEMNLYTFRAKERFLGGEIVLREFSVTATENVLMACALIVKKTTIKIAAAEPHVEDLMKFLGKMGVSIKGEGTHTVIIEGRRKLSGARHSVIYDPIEAGTFILMAIATKGKVMVKNVPVPYLDLFFKKLKEAGAKFAITRNDCVIVNPAKKIKLVKIQALPYPGIPTDLQSIFGVLATQAEGSTLIHDPLYEGRLKYLEELNKMGAEIVICDPHRAIVSGPTQLYGAEVGPFDLRGGAALVMAGLLAKGTTVISDIAPIDRGYEKIEERLKALGADIRRIKS
ncbi:MAG: UDP-N-acetylglucosamine 1-carboxyvinyltransferase [bacterium]